MGGLPVTLGLVLWLTFGITAIVGQRRTAWGSDCPRECQCHYTPLGHATMSQWVDPGAGSRTRKSSKWIPGEHKEPLKVAMCVLGRESQLNKLFRRIPHDTQVLTILQTQDCPPMVLMEQQSQHLQQLLALEVQAHSSQAFHFALGSNALRPLRKLQYLSLRGVDISAQPIGLSKLRGLRYLSLQENHLEALSRDMLTGLLVLEELTIAHNNLRDLPPLAFVELPSLRRLHLNDNRLQGVDANSLVSLDELEALDLSGNNLSDVSMISFPPLPRLQWLHLQNNPIRVVFLNAFHSLNGTSVLTLGHKEQSLHIMKFSFAGLASLKSLLLPNLDNQILEKDMFQGLDSLRSLTLRGQVKAVGPEAFAGAHSLERLTLRHCQLRRIDPDAFQGLKGLRALDLSGNAITKLPPTVFDKVRALQELELQHNNLHFLPAPLLAPLRLQTLRLEGNPWHCTCAMVKWDRSVIGRVKKVQNRKCHSAATVTAANSLSNNLSDGGASNDMPDDHATSAAAATGGSCKKTKVRYIRDPTLRPVCHSPAEVKGKKVFDALRRDLGCYEESAADQS